VLKPILDKSNVTLKGLMHKPTCMCIHDVTSCPVMCAVLCHSVCWSREHRAVWVDEHVHGRRWAQHRNASSIHCQNYGRV